MVSLGKMTYKWSEIRGYFGPFWDSPNPIPMIPATSRHEYIYIQTADEVYCEFIKFYIIIDHSLIIYIIIYIYYYILFIDYRF
jgi:hypothetical protein